MIAQKIILEKYVVFGENDYWTCRSCQLKRNGHPNRIIAHLTRNQGKGIRICPKISSEKMEELKRELGLRSHSTDADGQQPQQHGEKDDIRQDKGKEKRKGTIGSGTSGCDPRNTEMSLLRASNSSSALGESSFVSDENIWSYENLEKTVGLTGSPRDNTEQNFFISDFDFGSFSFQPETGDAPPMMSLPGTSHDRERAYVPNTDNGGFQGTSAVGSSSSELLNIIHQGQSSSSQGQVDHQHMHPYTSTRRNAHGVEMASEIVVADEPQPPCPPVFHLCSRNFERGVSSDNCKIREEEIGYNAVSNRKKDQEDSNSKTRSNKRQKLASSGKETLNIQCNVDSLNEEDEKRKARLMRNREVVRLSRQRKQHYVEELEEKVRNMHSTIAELNSKIYYTVAENVSLRQQLGGGGPAVCTLPMYPPLPMAHMAFLWVSYAPNVIPQGQVPLVPIPRLKPQRHVSGSKPKKSESRQSERKTRKVAIVSLLGLLFFGLLFRGLVPMVNVKFGGTGERIYGGSGYCKDGLDDCHRGRVLSVQVHRKGSFHDMERADIGRISGCENELSCDRGYSRGSDSKPVRETGGIVLSAISMESHVSSLFVLWRVQLAILLFTGLWNSLLIVTFFV